MGGVGKFLPHRYGGGVERVGQGDFRIFKVTVGFASAGFELLRVSCREVGLAKVFVSRVCVWSCSHGLFTFFMGWEKVRS